MTSISRRMPDGDYIEPWYPSDALQDQYAQSPYVAEDPYATLPEALTYEQPNVEEVRAEQARRQFIASHEPLLPANLLGDSLSGLGHDYDTWRDVIDCSILLSVVPGAGAGFQTDQTFTLAGPPGVGGNFTFSGLSAPLQQLLRDVRTPRLAICVRQVACVSLATALPPPADAPTLTTNAAGGTILAGTYTIGYTWVDAAGETQISALSSITTTGATSTITITVPALPAGATGWNLYVGAINSASPLFEQPGSPFATTPQTITAPPAVVGDQPPAVNSTTQTTGMVLVQLVTPPGDILPLGAFALGQATFIPALQAVGPSALTDLSGTFRLQTASYGVNAPVNMTFQIAFSVIAVHPHSLTKRFSDLAVNK
jgi:hypothetical protein